MVIDRPATARTPVMLMNSNNPDNDDSIAIHLLEPVEFDCSIGQLLDPTQFGGLESPITVLAPVTFDAGSSR
jgi:hypothetical protein